MSKLKSLFWCIFLPVAVRLISLAWTPLTDTTEARYALIGRAIATSGNWITPMLDGAPFWAKPPLSFWATAASMRVFGANTFAAHLPHFLFIIAACAILYFWVRRFAGEIAAATTTALLATAPAFLYIMGGVMTDPALLLCCVISMTAFYNATTTGEKKYGYLFFAGLGLGLLAKGPLIFVLVGLPAFVWTLIKNKWRAAFRMPVITGAALMLAIAAPWYILAERATPGFLNYFIVGEHFMRYITPHWSGDLYGAGRGGMVGGIWLYFIIAMVPGIFLAVRKRMISRDFLRDEFVFYNLMFAGIPLVFFTFSRNIIPPYVLPMMLPMGVVIACAVGNNPPVRFFRAAAAVCVALLFALIAVEILAPDWTQKIGVSDKYNATHNLPTRDTYSAQFYGK